MRWMHRLKRIAAKLLGVDRALSKGEVVKRSTLFTIGYILSPLSFWNDTFVNIPIAYVAAYLSTLVLGKGVFPLAFFLAYMATNIAGFMLMHMGVRGTELSAKRLAEMLTAGTLYTIIATLLVERLG